MNRLNKGLKKRCHTKTKMKKDANQGTRTQNGLKESNDQTRGKEKKFRETTQQREDSASGGNKDSAGKI